MTLKLFYFDDGHNNDEDDSNETKVCLMMNIANPISSMVFLLELLI